MKIVEAIKIGNGIGESNKIELQFTQDHSQASKGRRPFTRSTTRNILVIKEVPSELSTCEDNSELWTGYEFYVMTYTKPGT